MPKPNGNTRRFRRRYLLGGVLIGAIGVASLCLGEGLLRFYVWCRGWTPNCYAAHLELFRPHEELGNEPAPNFHLRSGTFVITTNSLGLRGPDIKPRKPDGVQRVALLGGSSAFGYLVSDGEEAARLLESRLRAQGVRVEVINGGVPGYNLFQTVPRYKQVIAPLQPDIVMLYLGYNDWPYISSGAPNVRKFRVRPIAPAWERLLGQSTLYGFFAYRLLGDDPGFSPAASRRATPTPAGIERFRQNLDGLAAVIQESGAQMVVCSQVMAAHPRPQPSVLSPQASALSPQHSVLSKGQWLHDTLKEFARKHDAPFIDAYRQISPTKQVLGDVIHLTAEGERRLAELWATRISPLLQSNPTLDIEKSLSK